MKYIKYQLSILSLIFFFFIHVIFLNVIIVFSFTFMKDIFVRLCTLINLVTARNQVILKILGLFGHEEFSCHILPLFQVFSIVPPLKTFPHHGGFTLEN